MDSQKCYIGDGVYARMNLDRVVLTTEDGISVQNEIFLERETIGVLLLYLEQSGFIKKEAERDT